MNNFYHAGQIEEHGVLSEEEARHCALILRHTKGDEITVLDGKGGKFKSVLTHVTKNTCEFRVVESLQASPKKFSTHLIIAPTKNADRMEWLVEKITELGVDEISFVATQNAERRKIRMDRLEKKAISALKQSGNPFLPKINAILAFKEAIEKTNEKLKLIAHVDGNHQYIGDIVEANTSIALCIGPEGDFTRDEVNFSVERGFLPISLGSNTLRTETAGFTACCSVHLINKY